MLAVGGSVVRDNAGLVDEDSDGGGVSETDGVVTEKVGFETACVDVTGVVSNADALLTGDVFGILAIEIGRGSDIKSALLTAGSIVSDTSAVVVSGTREVVVSDTSDIVVSDSTGLTVDDKADDVMADSEFPLDDKMFAVKIELDSAEPIVIDCG